MFDQVVAGEGEVIKVGAHKRWKFAVALLALLGVGAWSSGSFDAQAISAVLKDPMSLFAARSPGERAPGALTQSKPARNLGTGVSRVPPRERVLSTGRTRPAVPVETADVGTPGMTVAPVDAIDDGVPIASTSFGEPGIVPGSGGGGAPFFVPPTSNGPGVSIGEPGDGGTVTPPTSPVPEPETWLTMMVGLFTIGAALRRRRSGLIAVSAVAPVLRDQDTAGTAHC